MLAIWFDISSVALAVWPASVLTSWATTAKPRPASPARGFDGGIQRQEVGLTELGWREFCRHLLHDHPNLATENLQANFDGG
jgi:deoxyribodipyrimidine photolyase